jgi:hypothetical protein
LFPSRFNSLSLYLHHTRTHTMLQSIASTQYSSRNKAFVFSFLPHPRCSLRQDKALSGRATFNPYPALRCFIISFGARWLHEEHGQRRRSYNKCALVNGDVEKRKANTVAQSKLEHIYRKKYCLHTTRHGETLPKLLFPIHSYNSQKKFPS